MGVYSGSTNDSGCEVTLDGAPLDPRFDLCVHSPTGFDCSTHAGRDQLALALVAAHLRDDERALAIYQEFADVFRPTASRWTITYADIARVIAQIAGAVD